MNFTFNNVGKRKKKQNKDPFLTVWVKKLYFRNCYVICLVKQENKLYKQPCLTAIRHASHHGEVGHSTNNN